MIFARLPQSLVLHASRRDTWVRYVAGSRCQDCACAQQAVPAIRGPRMRGWNALGGDLRMPKRT